MWNFSARSVIEASARPELLQNAASSGVRERGERGIEARLDTLNDMVALSVACGPLAPHATIDILTYV
jgi:hypothetical protein